MKTSKYFIMLIVSIILMSNNANILLAQGPGKALSLNGSNQYVDLGNHSGLDHTSSVSIETWVKKKELSRIESILSKGSYSLKVGADDRPYIELIEGSETIKDLGLSTDNNIYALTVFDGKLYAGLSRFQGGSITGRVYRYDSGTVWSDVGKLGTTDWVYCLTVYNGTLYAGTGKPGKVFRYDGNSVWTDIGQPGDSKHVRVLVVFDGNLYGGGSAGKVYRYNGDSSWTNVGQLGSDNMVHVLAVHDGKLYGGGYYTRRVYLYDGDTTWTEVGQFESTGNYVLSLAVYDEKLYAGTGGGGLSKVYRYDGGTDWSEVGSLGSWTASLVVYNGKLYAGASNNGAKIYRYEGDSEWINIGQLGLLDQIWSMVVYDGKLCAGAGHPFSYQGNIYSMGNGLAAYSGTPLNGRYSHIAAVYDGNAARIYLDGVEAGSSSGDMTIESNNLHLLIGGSYGSSQGANTCSGEEYFNGVIDEVRVWGTAISETTIREWMCKKITPSHPDWIDLNSYIRFDDSDDIYLMDHSEKGTIGTMINLNPDTSLIRSGAAIGDESIYVYDRTPFSEVSISLSHKDGDSFTVTGESGAYKGIHLYGMEEASLQPDPIAADNHLIIDPLRFWGIYFVGSDKPTYSIVYKYDKHPGILDEVDLDLVYCNDYSENQWRKSDAELDVHAKTLRLDVQTDCGIYVLASRIRVNSRWEDLAFRNPRGYMIYQNYPNPFNPSTVIGYQLPVGCNVTLKLYNILGKEVATLVDEYKPAGMYQAEFNAADLPSGTYIYRLQAGEYLGSRKMLILK
jgi:hypothetical protein